MFPSPVFRFRCALALSLAVVTCLALIRVPELPITFWDKASHGLTFFFLTYLADRSFPQTTSTPLHPAKLWGLFAYGVLIEALQGLLPYRETSALDLLANASGLAVYATLFFFDNKLDRRRSAHG